MATRVEIEEKNAHSNISSGIMVDTGVGVVPVTPMDSDLIESIISVEESNDRFTEIDEARFDLHMAINTNNIGEKIGYGLLAVYHVWNNRLEYATEEYVDNIVTKYPYIDRDSTRLSIEMPLSEVFFESAFKTIEMSGSSIKSFYQTKISKTRLKNVSNIEKSTAKIPKTLEDFESFIDDVNAGKVNPYDVMKEGNVPASFDKIEREVLDSGNFRLKLEETGKAVDSLSSINPKKINFMQSTMKNTTGNYTVLENAKSLKAGTLKPSDLPAIRVWKDANGKVWTLDHRRLGAFKLAE